MYLAVCSCCGPAKCRRGNVVVSQLYTNGVRETNLCASDARTERELRSCVVKLGLKDADTERES